MAACFDSSSNQNLKLFACGPEDGDVKSCCAATDSCASNGLCVTSNEETLTPYFIGGCTDQDWNATTCITQCDDSGGNGVASCGKGTYCCYGTTGCDCGNDDEVFTLDPVSIITSIPADASTRLIATSTSTISSAISTTTSDYIASSTSTTSVDESSDDGGGSGLAIGLGVGLGTGLSITALVIIAIIKRRRAKKNKVDKTPFSQTDEPPVNQTVELAAKRDLPKYSATPGPTFAAELDPNNRRPVEMA